MPALRSGKSCAQRRFKHPGPQPEGAGDEAAMIAWYLAAAPEREIAQANPAH